MFQLVPLLVDCGLGIHNVHRINYSDGLMHHTVVEFGHVSLLRRCGHAFQWLVLVPALLLTFTASIFLEGSNFSAASCFSQHASLRIHGIERTSHCLNVAQTSKIISKYSVFSNETSKIHLFQRASCNLACSSSQATPSSRFCFIDRPRRSSGQIVLNRA